MVKALELVGKIFGHLTVIEQMPNEKGKTMWLCQCSCGNKITLIGAMLKFGHYKSCGCSHGLTLQEYIKSKVKIDEDGKWLWQGMSIRGYGRAKWKGKEWKAHRLSYTAFIGDIPAGMLVCHKNDCPQDVNSKNLFLGSPAQNSNDMVRKERSLKGSKNHEATVTEEDVKTINKMLAEGMRVVYIAKKLGISSHIVSKIKSGKTWKHVK